MNQENQGTNEVFMDTVSTKLINQDQKIHAQDERLSALESKISQSPDNSNDIRDIKASILAMRTDVEKFQFPMQKLEQFSKLLGMGILALNQPLKSEVKHHHHIPGVTLAAIGLIIALCLTATGWYMTANQMSRYNGNDIKYRHLKLTTDSASAAYLFWLDSVYDAAPDSFKNVVLEKERLKEKRLELLDQVRSVNRRMNELNGKAGERKDGKK